MTRDLTYMVMWGIRSIRTMYVPRPNGAGTARFSAVDCVHGGVQPNGHGCSVGEVTPE